VGVTYISGVCRVQSPLKYSFASQENDNDVSFPHASVIRILFSDNHTLFTLGDNEINFLSSVITHESIDEIGI
jgi:hypothetical protein